MREIVTNNMNREVLKVEIDRDTFWDWDGGRFYYEKRLTETNEVVIKAVVSDNPYLTEHNQEIPWEVELFEYEEKIPGEEIVCFLNWLCQRMELWDEDKFQNVIACFYCVGGDDSYIVRYFNMQPIGKKNGHTVYCWRREFTPNLK